MEANALGNLGVIFLELGPVKNAIELLEQARILFQQVGNREQETNILLNIGTSYLYIKQPERALEYFNQALDISRETEDRSQEARFSRIPGLDTSI